MEGINSLVSYLGGVVWGPYMLVLLLGTGVWLTLSLGFIQIRCLPRALKLIMKRDSSGKGEIPPLQALTTAMSATVGTGNIVGVATALAAGGPGAIFWMWVTAFFGMATKYAEAVLAVTYRKELEDGSTIGGPMYYISEGLKLKWLGAAFAIFGMFASFGIGSMVQCNAVANSMNTAFNIPPIVTGVIVTALTALVIIGGITRIGRVTEKLVPFMAVLYFILVMIIVIMNVDKLGGVIALIIESAFNPVAATGGFAGSVVRDAMRYGVARGVFSNESGLGSAPIAHAAAKTDNAVRQGLIAMTGTFFDTIILCTLTAFAILLTGVWSSGATGSELTGMAFVQSFGGIGDILLAVTLAIFAYSTIIGWSYYGEQCSKFLFGIKFSYFYKAIYCFSVFYGALWKTDFVWNVSDMFNGMMAVPNLIGLLGLSFVLMKVTKEKMKDV
ncbi:alanine/glycine:cation symporter family protein [Limisalsivibrio acetivorans]|uniref:alanine/glycine:cation symporter family protein n=1 Tax=Limisalsivibrio acetivorans TaxID=1304888 RepID=UPI0003B5B029|nr:sodium:alanine symporter family protein [Limisalsivibrio acetivorans]